VGEEALGDTHIGEEGTNESACAETVQPTESERNAKGSNVERSVRGTIAFICHRSGTSIKPQYNRCGILTALEFQDGSRFVRSSGPKPWMVLDADGEEQSQPKVASVSMGRRGTISFVCENGEKTVLCTSGAKIVLQQ
jgi:hypothetical protein